MEESSDFIGHKYGENNNSTVNYYEEKADEYFIKTFNTDISDLWVKLSDQKIGVLLLDLGCGSGRDLKYFARKKIKTIGVDLSYNLLKHAHNFSKRPVVQANMLSLPFGNGSFDVVWSIGSLLHVPRDLINVALSEVHRILKKKSIFIASTKKGVGESIDNEGRFFTYYSDTEWAKMLINNCFMISSLEVTPEVRENKTIDWIVSVSINQ